jgi:beta-glucanase (GH16 family)
MHSRLAIGAAVAGLASYLPLASAWTAPEYSGFNKQWESTFQGDTGTFPSDADWSPIAGYNVNGNVELQEYKVSTSNLQLSGGDTLQIFPLRDSSVLTGWSSARIESTYDFSPTDGRVTKAEVAVRLGLNGDNAGMWPAVWMLGRNIGEVGWPACGELDLFEMRNGDLIGHGVVHCDVYPGGICNEGTGITGETTVPNNDWHTWTVEWNLASDDWRADTITWYMDGNQYHQISGGSIGNEDVWKSLAQNPMYFIINVAVGGLFPGNPVDGTVEGANAMLEVGYLAVYESV